MVSESILCTVVHSVISTKVKHLLRTGTESSISCLNIIERNSLKPLSWWTNVYNPPWRPHEYPAAAAMPLMGRCYFNRHYQPHNEFGVTVRPRLLNFTFRVLSGFVLLLPEGYMASRTANKSVVTSACVESHRSSVARLTRWSRHRSEK